jgi:hypothetical protein
MTVTKNDASIAREFWARTALPDAFPRDIEKAVALTLPFALVKLPSITVPVVRRWLEARRLRAQIPNDPRDLMGCLVAHRGLGIAFVSGADPDEEQRLTVAHETSHFLRDYLLPRHQIIQALGSDIADVLDGRRPPTLQERANAVLSHVRVGAHVHLLPRNGEDESSDPVIAGAEDKADSLGLELVAPRDQILALLRQAHPACRDGDTLCTSLGTYFGLPTHAFRRFVEVPAKPRIVSFLDDIRPALGARR